MKNNNIIGKNILTSVLGLVLCTVVSVTSASPFDKGQQHMQLAIGSGTILDENYIILGIGYAYYLQSGLELGIDFDLWLDGDPSIYQVTPEVRYVFDLKSSLKPYIGAFYRRNYIEGFDDRDAYGYRGGIYWATSNNTFIGYGITYSKLQDCRESVYFDCESTSTEISVMVSIN